MTLAVVLVIIAAAVYFSQGFKSAGGGKGKLVGTGVDSVEAVANAESKSFLQEFEKRVYSSGEFEVETEHFIRFTKGSRVETLILSNKGSKQISLNLLKIMPPAVYQRNYSSNASVLSFASNEEKNWGVIEDNEYSLEPEQVLVVRVWSSATEDIGVLFIPVLDERVDVSDLKNILEEKVLDNDNEDGVRVMELSASDSDRIADEITKIVNSGKEWADKKIELAEILSETPSATISREFVFTAKTSEALPAAWIEMPLIQGSADGEKSKVLVKGIEGKLSKYVEQGFPQITTDDSGNRLIQVLFDFRKAQVKGGRFWDEETGTQLDYASGAVELAYANNLDLITKIPLSVEVNHVLRPTLFVLPSPRSIRFTQGGGETKKPLFVTNSYEFPVTVAGCGFEESTLIQSHEAKYVFVTSSDVGCTVMQNGEPLHNNVVEASYASDKWARQISYLFEAEEEFNGRECIDNICECSALRDFLEMLKERYAVELALYYLDENAAEKTIGESYARTVTVLASDLKECELTEPFNNAFGNQKTENDAAYAITLKAKPFFGKELDFEAEAKKILEKR